MFEERYISPKKIYDYIVKLKKTVNVKIIGKSVQQKPIYQLKIGSGSKKILLWSQMHGNETTTTKALFDFIPWLTSKANNEYLKSFTFYIILQLNPDGAELYKRNNFNDVDLNRDAVKLSQPESKCLIKLYNSITPDFCFNLHEQRTIYSVGDSEKSAVISFLAPSINFKNEINKAREKSILLIISLFNVLNTSISGHISTYKDDFNENCMGDHFTINNTPTVLIEAGHYPDDYKREVAKKHVLNTLISSTISLFNEKYLDNSVEDYFKIPESKGKFVDLILSGVTINNKGKKYKNQMLALNYKESVKKGKIQFTPYFVSFGKKLNYYGHKHINLSTEKNNIFNFKLGVLLKKHKLIDLLLIK